MDIRLIYDAENAITASYWEYYFKSCGIWVEKRKYEDEWRLEEGDPCLIIMNPLSAKSYQDAGISSHVCLLTNYEETLDCLFGADPECRSLVRLFEIYSDSDLWKAIWVYEEFAKDGTQRWDNIIAGSCRKALKSIDRKLSEDVGSRYVQYMRFYCRYIYDGITYRTMPQRPLKSRELLDDFLPLLSQYGEKAVFQHLAGRICELHPVENKHAPFFYRQAARCSDHSDYLYDIGHSLEKIYGEDETALRFYQKAYQRDKNNYRALYKLAVGRELEQEWKEAFTYYGMIERQLKKVVEDNYTQMNAVSTRELDYLYKAYNRLLYIYRQIFGCGRDKNSYTLKMEAFKEKLLSGYSFVRLTESMGVPQIGMEITGELLNKFQGKCYRYKL